MSKIIKRSEPAAPEAALVPQPAVRPAAPAAASRSIKKKDTYDAELQIKVLEEQAAREVEAVREAAEEEGAQRRQAAFAQGRALGLRDGARDAARTLLEGKIAARRSDGENADEAGDLALHIARKIVGPDLRLATEQVRRIIEDEVATLRRRRGIRLRLAVGDLEEIERRMPALLLHLDAAGDLEVVPDGSLEPDACALETEGLAIPCSAAQLSEVLAELYAGEVEVGEALPAPAEAPAPSYEDALQGPEEVPESGDEAWDDEPEPEPEPVEDTDDF